MFDQLQIPARRERLLVGLADLALTPLGWRRRHTTGTPQRILLLRLERIGDLLMVLDAIAAARSAWPDADIDIAVGSWNAPLANLIDGLRRVDVLDVPWLAREGTGLAWTDLWSRAGAWRTHRYDLVINFEPDIRSNLLAWRSRAPKRVGYWTGGGGSLLTDAAVYDPAVHVAVNARNLVHQATGDASASGTLISSQPTLTPPASAHDTIDACLTEALGRRIGLHVSGGRQSKQWHLDRFAEFGRILGTEPDTTLVLTGGSGDRRLVDAVRQQLDGVSVIDTAGTLDLPETAALLARLDVLVTGDTGPMHLAAAVGTPVVALFGPSDPQRYGPLTTQQRVLRVQLPCSPCGLVRLPPERCRGRVPECMDGITVDMVVNATRDVLGARRESST